MKRTLLALGLLSALALPATGFAQSAVPLNISYQGRVTTAAGTLLGLGTPVNRQVIFRIYSGPTSTTILHSERQTVTIADGEFSVLLGVGDPVGTEPRLALDAAFLGAQRYLGITVDNGNDNDALNDIEISPRQQIVATPFAFRSRIAEGLADNALSSATMIANNAITGVKLADNAITSAKITNLSIVAEDLADSSITSAKIANSSVATIDLADAAVTAAKLGSDVGVWSVNGANVHRNSNVGIGNTSGATERLTISGGSIRLDWGRYLGFTTGATDTFTYLGQTVPLYGMGSFFDTELGNSASLWFSSNDGYKFFTGGGGRLTINRTGNVAVGHSNAVLHDTLNVYSSATSNHIRIQSATTGTGSADGIRIGTDGSTGFLENLDTGGWGLRSGGANRITVEANGRIGLGQANGDQNVQVLVANPSSLNFPFAIATTSGAWFYFDQSGNAFKPTGSTWAVNSDARLKTDIKDLTGSLDQLLRLHGVTFRFKDEARYTAGQQTGFIAQEVEKIFPSWVGDGPDGFKAITVKGFEALTVEALRELRAEKDAQIAALTTRAETAESRLAALEKQVAALTAALSAQR